jgi:hypothetical protein
MHRYANTAPTLDLRILVASPYFIERDIDEKFGFDWLVGVSNIVGESSCARFSTPAG